MNVDFDPLAGIVHTALSDPTLNTNIKLWFVAFFFITVVVVVVIVVDIYSCCFVLFFNVFYFHPVQEKKKKNIRTICQSALYQPHKITAILDRRLLQQPSRQTLGTVKYQTQGNC